MIATSTLLHSSTGTYITMVMRGGSEGGGLDMLATSAIFHSTTNSDLLYMVRGDGEGGDILHSTKGTHMVMGEGGKTG